MSTMKMDSFCNKFQANVFNKSKCQNCFKSRELHLRTNEDLCQAKPIYGGWLCLAPEGTDFGNPAQRSRKWQRRFFILYEHGSLHFALDESPSTLPQGTVNMNLCTDVVDAEPKTGQRNALCIITPDQDFFIRGDNKDIINGWCEQLVAYPDTNKQNRKNSMNKHMPLIGTQVPKAGRQPGVKNGVLADSTTENSIHGSDDIKVTQVDSTSQMIAPPDPALDEAPHREAIVPPQKSDLLSPLAGGLGAGRPVEDLTSSLSAPAAASSLLRALQSRQDPPETENPNGHYLDFHTLSSAAPSPICASSPRARRAERRTGQTELSSGQQKSDNPVEGMFGRGHAGAAEEASAVSGNQQARTRLQPGSTHRPKRSDALHVPSLPERRAQSPDHRISESFMTPDLLNFKKGWLMVLDKQNEWKKNWFVLSTHNLRYYKDAVAEEASELMGEIDLTTCHQVTDHQVQRNYGFQIHTQPMVHTLAAMTAGIRRNWIQALAKNVRPSNTPDAIMSLSDDLGPFSSSSVPLCEPDLTRDSLSPEVSAKMRQAAKRRYSHHHRRREGGAAAKPYYGGGGGRSGGPAAPPRHTLLATGVDEPDQREVPVEVWSVERRRRRREERRKRYESVMGLVLEPRHRVEEVLKTRGGGGGVDVGIPPLGLLEEVLKTRGGVDVDVGVCIPPLGLLEEVLKTRGGGGGDVGVGIPPLGLLEEVLKTRGDVGGVDDVGVGVGIPPLGLLEEEQQREQRVQEIEERWQQVEKAAIRQERRVPLYPDTPAKDAGQLERLLHNYKRRVEELTIQLTESSGLSTALEEPMSSSWNFQLGSHTVQESGAIPVKMDSLLFSSHVSSLTDKYRETKELLRLEEIRRQRMQEQLGLAPSAKLCDGGTDDRPGRNSLESGCPELLEHLSFTSFEELRSSSVTQTKQAPGGGNGADGRLQSEAEKGLVQEVLSLTRQNEALNQRNQEMVHQLTEADREIERLRSELCERQDGRPRCSSDLEELSRARVEGLENTLREKCAELQEVQAQLAAQTDRLMDALRQLQMKEEALEDTRGQECSKVDHSHRKQQHHQQQVSDIQLEEEDCLDCGGELCILEAEDRETLDSEMPLCCLGDEVTQSQMVLEAKRSDECETVEQASSNGLGPEKEASVHRLVDALQTRSETLGRLLQLTGETDSPVLLPPSFVSERQEAGVSRGITARRLHLEEEVWATLFNHLKSDRTRHRADEDVFGRLTAEQAGAKLEEIKLLLTAHGHFSSSSTIDSQIVCTAPPPASCSSPMTNDCSVPPESNIISRTESAEFSDEEVLLRRTERERILSLYRRLCNGSFWTSLRESVLTKTHLLSCIASRLESSADTELRETAQGLCSLWSRQGEEAGPLWSRQGEAGPLYHRDMGSELLCVYLVSQIETVQEEAVQTEASVCRGEETCENCQLLRKANEELRARLSDLLSQRSQGQISSEKTQLVSGCASDGAPMMMTGSVEQEMQGNPLQGCNSGPMQTEEHGELVADTEDNENSLSEAQDSLVQNVEGNAVTPIMASTHGEPEAGCGNPRREEKLTDGRGDERDGSSALQEQHRRDLESLKATCEQGLLAMEGAHQRAQAELRLQHQRELALLQQEKDTLLAEETAATHAAIEAMKRAYQKELEKVLQDKQVEQCTLGNADVEEILKRHREELCSSHEELEVLSQQYSLKCLESAHLAQALEAERRALQQCQRQYQDISARHQEVSGLASVDILPSSLCKDAADPIQREKILYELQIVLRVKRAEVNFLTQEIGSLKEELQAAQRDKRYATERCSDMHTELSVMRARAQRDIEELREHLRLAHQALDTSSEVGPPGLDTSGGI